MTESQQDWQPDWGVSPGEILAEALAERALSQLELARRMGRPAKTINEIINGKAAITPETALQLEATLGISAAFWNGLESRFRQRVAATLAQEQHAAEAAWAETFPVRDLKRIGVVGAGATGSALTADLLRFFGVANRKAWESTWSRQVALYRQSDAFPSATKSIATWLRLGERESSTTDLPPFDATAFLQVLDSARGWSRLFPPASGVDRVREASRGAGVNLVLTPELKDTHISGAIRRLPAGQAVVQLSLRHRRDDQFWFTFFHEAAHLILGHNAWIDAWSEGIETGGLEQEADDYARDLLIPPKAYAQFVKGAEITSQSIQDFAAAVGVAPGIVVGRLQKDQVIGLGRLNDLKRELGWQA